jgi:hypothetical protein
MIKNLLIKVTVPLVSALMLISCKTSYMTVDVLKPARIDVPNEIKTVAVLNRSLPDKGEKAGNIIEGILTGEGIFNDRLGSEKCIYGIVDLLNNSPRFKAVRPTDIDIRGTGTGAFPAPLEWQYVSELCDRYNVDAIITLETFDSDSYIDFDRHEYTREEDGRKVRVVEFEADLNMDIQSGWRIYDASRQSIIDENVYVDRMSWDARGPTKEAARRNLPSKGRIIEDAGYFAGQQYAERISPVWINVTRDFYSKGNEQLETAARYAKQGRWTEAAEIWEDIANSSDPDIAGYACYNIALANEMNGDLETAISWAEKSYTNYGNKRARRYIEVLKNRLYDQGRLDKQLQD